MSIESFKMSDVKKNRDITAVDKRMAIKENLCEKIQNVFNPDIRLEKLYTTYKERFDQTPKDLERWCGKRAESLCLPASQESKEALVKLGLKGIEYKNGLPNVGFEKCAETKVKIDMTSEMARNFKKADTECVKQWNKENKDGRNNWTTRECEIYRQKNNLTWHECSDRENCYLIPKTIHNDFGHTGGRAECRRIDEILNNKKGVTFDE